MRSVEPFRTGSTIHACFRLGVAAVVQEQAASKVGSDIPYRSAGTGEYMLLGGVGDSPRSAQPSCRREWRVELVRRSHDEGSEQACSRFLKCAGGTYGLWEQGYPAWEKSYSPRECY